MSEDDVVQPGTRIDKSVWEAFRSDVEDRHGMVRGNLRRELENALRAYIDASEGGDTHDRLRRLENAVERIDERTEDLVDVGGAKNKKGSNASVGPRRKKKLDAIESQIDREAGDATKVHKSVIHKAIEDNAGTSGPTIRTYKRMLKERRIAFETPSEDANTWFVDPAAFVNVVESNYRHRNHEIAAEYGEEWWETAVEEFVDWNEEDEEDEERRGFQ